MPKYKVHVCRTAYSHLEIEVEAPNQMKAEQKVMVEAGNHSFPTENSSQYSIEGITKL